ncbi:hypothetical protein EDD22DRAFT_932971 [Suillus occidentalis]|nr:hypothetical protein EDD22DRAFT_932971 [Suillus occidentalis]
MAILLDNPNDAIIPDFTTGEHRAARARLIADGIANDASAAQLLAALWTMNNNAAKDAWAEQVQEAARTAEEAQRLADEEEQQRQVALEEEQEAARKEDHKKNKAKFVPVATTKIPTGPIVIPSHYAVRKLKAGEYCELHYFTNVGLADARKNLLSSEPKGMILLPSEDGQQIWVNADETRDTKSTITRDENLSWEQFNEAAPRMIIAMKQHEWPKDRRSRTTCWRHSFDTLKQRALLLYQRGPFGWTIAELNHELILEAREEIFNQDRDTALAALKQSSSLSNNNRNQQNTNSCSFSSQKRPLSPNAESSDSKKKQQRSFREPTNPILSHALLCVECNALRTWDNLFDVYSERISKALWTKDGRQLCTAWQREEGCSSTQHNSKHLCSGCGATEHGAQRCARAQKV